MAYKKGDFGHFSKAARVASMQLYLKKLETKLLAGDIPFNERHSVNSEIEDLHEKITRGKSAIEFDLQDFIDFVRKYNSEVEFKQEIDDKIAGTWVDPKNRPVED